MIVVLLQGRGIICCAAFFLPVFMHFRIVHFTHTFYTIIAQSIFLKKCDIFFFSLFRLFGFRGANLFPRAGLGGVRMRYLRLLTIRCGWGGGSLLPSASPPVSTACLAVSPRGCWPPWQRAYPSPSRWTRSAWAGAGSSSELEWPMSRTINVPQHLFSAGGMEENAVSFCWKFDSDAAPSGEFFHLPGSVPSLDRF